MGSVVIVPAAVLSSPHHSIRRGSIGPQEAEVDILPMRKSHTDATTPFMAGEVNIAMTMMMREQPTKNLNYHTALTTHTKQAHTTNTIIPFRDVRPRQLRHLL